MHVRVDTHGDQKGASDPLELELKVAISCLMWVLETKLQSSVRAVSVL